MLIHFTHKASKVTRAMIHAAYPTSPCDCKHQNTPSPRATLLQWPHTKHFCSFTHHVFYYLPFSVTSTSKDSTPGQESMGGHFRTSSASVLGPAAIPLPPPHTHHLATKPPSSVFSSQFSSTDIPKKAVFTKMLGGRSPLLVGDSYILIFSLPLTHSSHSTSIIEFLPCAMCF